MLNSSSSVRRFAAVAALMTLAACGGGGDSGGATGAAPPPPVDPGPTPPPPSPPPPAPPPPSSGFGTLLVTGPGVSGVDGDFNAVLIAPVASITGPTCDQTGQGASVCSTSFVAGWIDTNGSSEALGIALTSRNIPAPGATAGSQVNEVLIQLGTASKQFSVNCSENVATNPCSVAPLGVSLDATRREVIFVNTALTSVPPGGDGIILNGTLKY